MTSYGIENLNFGEKLEAATNLPFHAQGITDTRKGFEQYLIYSLIRFFDAKRI